MNRSALALLTLTPLVLVGCSASSTPSPTSDDASVAELVTQVAEPRDDHPVGVLLEGPTFDPDGDLYLVDVTAPPGSPKLLQVDLTDGTTETVYTDDTSLFTSAQFSPADGRIYLTDFVGGTIQSIEPDGTDARTVFSGHVDGRPMMPDDLAFDPDGNMIVTDSTGATQPGWDAQGRIIRIGTDGQASVIADSLAAPNGIAFDERFAGLWISQNTGNRVDYIGLDAARTEVLSGYPAIYVDAGRAQIDSLAVDAAGNIYQGFHNDPRIEIYSPVGELLKTVRIDDEGISSTTNIAIRPGTNEAFVVASGSSGGFIYRFDALAKGTRQSNGG